MRLLLLTVVNYWYTGIGVWVNVILSQLTTCRGSTRQSHIVCGLDWALNYLYMQASCTTDRSPMSESCACSCRSRRFFHPETSVLGLSLLSTDFDAWSTIDGRLEQTQKWKWEKRREGGRGEREDRVGVEWEPRDPTTPSAVDRWRLCPANENEQLAVVMDAFEIKSRVWWWWIASSSQEPRSSSFVDAVCPSWMINSEPNNKLFPHTRAHARNLARPAANLYATHSLTAADATTARALPTARLIHPLYTNGVFWLWCL